ncbi:hypothetical protein DOZ80_26020 [Pseudomonas fluorescens]|uniref:Uncharacterized protein n=1 Tax=Pseudomonas fluorescens TaxID=294 RepID=A0A327MQ72_PSEFL|nr:hypothetical protein [Pseudomonas fluorescens]RAI64582.1 hypothetical protein DOZ80_26020 [Pseudomonas fluorescens]
MLAMVANDNAGNLTPRGVLGFIASKLAPTGYSPSAPSAPLKKAGTARTRPGVVHPKERGYLVMIFQQ